MGYADALGGAGADIGAAIGYYTTGDDREKIAKQYQNELQAYQKMQTHRGEAFDAQGNQQDRSAQLEAMAQLRDIYSQGGLDASTRAQIADVENQNARQANAANANISNQMAQRGLSNSGASFAQQQLQAQQAQDASAQGSRSALALGRQQQMGALGQYGQMANGMRGADDAINQFNAQNRSANSRFNAQQSNSMEQYQTGGVAGSYKDIAGDQSRQTQQEQAAAAGVGEAAGTIAGSAMDAYTGGTPSGANSGKASRGLTGGGGL